MRSLIHEPRVIAGIALMLIATIAGGLLLQHSSRRITVWQLSAPLTAGSVVTSRDVHLAEVAIDGAEDLYAPASARVSGRTLSRDVVAGELLPKSAFAPSVAPFDEVSIPVERMHAVSDLARGERVDVWWSDTPDQGQPVHTRRVLQHVRVAAVSDSEMAGAVAVVLAVAADDVAELVTALRSGRIDLVRSTGAA